MNKKRYRTPIIRVIQLRNLESLLQSQSVPPGGDDGGNGTGDAKRATYLINDDDNIFDNRSSYDEEETYNHFDL